MQNLWDACLRRLEQELPAQQFNTWIRPLTLDATGSDIGKLTLVAPNRFVLELVRERFSERIRRCAGEAGPQPVEINVVLARTRASTSPTQRADGGFATLDRVGSIRFCRR